MAQFSTWSLPDMVARTNVFVLLLGLLLVVGLGTSLFAQEATEGKSATTAEPVIENDQAASDGQVPGEQSPAEEGTSVDAAESSPSKASESEDSLVDDKPAENAGLNDLDEATTLKVTTEGLSDVNRVVDLLDLAIDKGLDPDNLDFAEQMLMSTLIQRARALSAAILNRPLPNPRQDPRWIQIRQFAMTDLHRALELESNQWEAHFYIGKLQSLPLGDIRAARRAFTRMIDTEGVPDRELADAYALRGATRPNEPKKQLQDFTKAVELSPGKPDYIRVRAEAMYRAKRYDEALVDTDKALELENEHASTHELRGMVLLGQEKYDEAKQSFDRASELAPEAILPYQHRGEMYRRQGEIKNAIEQLNKALKIKPDDVATLLIRSGLLFQSGDSEQALDDVNKVIELSPGLVKAYQMKAEIHATEQRWDEAIKGLKQILQVAPDRPELRELQYQLATYYLIQSQSELAIETFTKVLEWNDDNANALRGRGDAYLNLGKHEEAIADFESALSIDNEDQGLLNNLAWVLATSPFDEFRNGERAIELATKACELTAFQMPHILSTLAAAHAETGDFESAVKWSTQAVELGEGDPNQQQLAEELAEYKAGKPWRENKPIEPREEEKSGAEPDAGDQISVPGSASTVPDHTTDF
jgi:tetratricopeptide (TPR) repeat protein